MASPTDGPALPLTVIAIDRRSESCGAPNLCRVPPRACKTAEDWQLQAHCSRRAEAHRACCYLQDALLRMVAVLFTTFAVIFGAVIRIVVTTCSPNHSHAECADAPE